MNPEEERVAFHHGFEATIGSQRPRVIVRAGTGFESVWEGSLGEMKRQPGRRLMTIILKADRSRCSVGGQAVWSADAVARGISGSIKEWLACAGVTLDTDPQSVFASKTMTPKHLRTLGLAMQLVLEYTNVHSEPNHDGVVCFVTVKVEPLSAAAALEHTDIVQLPLPSQNQTAWRTRASRGVAVSLKASGRYRYFNLSAAPQVLINMLVLFQLPALVLNFIVLRCLGKRSKVYRNARTSRLDPLQQIFSAITRSMVAEAGFRATLGGAWEGGMADLEGLTQEHLFHHLRHVYRDELKSGAIQEAQLQQVALAAVHRLGTTETGTVSCAQFVRACMASDSVSLQDVAGVVTEYQRPAQEKIQDVHVPVVDRVAQENTQDGQLGNPERAKASSAVVPSQRKEWEAEVAKRLTLLEQQMSGKPHSTLAEGNGTTAMGLLSLLQNLLQDRLGSGNAHPADALVTLQKEELERLPSTCTLASQVLSFHEHLQRTDERLKRVESQTDAKDGAADVSEFPSSVLKKLDQQMMELRQDCERRIRALEQHLRISPVQETLVKNSSSLSTRNLSRLPLDAIGNSKLLDAIGDSKLLEEPLKATSAGLAGAGSACSTARGSVSTALCDAQSRMTSTSDSASASLESTVMTVRGPSVCESSAVINELDLSEMLGQEEKAETCQGIITSQGLDHVQVWYPFEALGDTPKAPEAPAAVMLKESVKDALSAPSTFVSTFFSWGGDNHSRVPAALPPLSLAGSGEVNQPVISVPVPPAQPSFHDPHDPRQSTRSSLIPPVPETKPRATREPPKDSPRVSQEGSPRESDLLRRRPDFGKAELGVECRRYLPAAGKQRSQSQPPAEAASRAATERSSGAMPALSPATAAKSTGTA
jgi:hypothetical protein